MNKWLGVVLVVITVVAVGMAIRTQKQLRAARAVVSQDLSGNAPIDLPTNAVSATVLIPEDNEVDVAALQAECAKLKADLAAAQAALAAREQNKGKAKP